MRETSDRPSFSTEAAGLRALAAEAVAFRAEVRSGAWTTPTAGAVPGALQANLAVMPAAEAAAFETFCRLNPRPCPMLARTLPGEVALPSLGADIDVARDLPAYRLLRDGRPAERVASLAPYWADDTVAFAIGCSFSFEAAMARAGLALRHLAHGRNVAMYLSDIETVPVAPFGGRMVVSMRPIPEAQVEAVVALSARFPFAHGAPVHAGDPAAIGIRDLSAPDFGDPPASEPGDVPVFWACGVTAQMALREARLPFAAAHEPGHMLVTDLDAADPGLADWRAA